MNLFEGLDAHWMWIAIGLILAVLEMLLPGVYLIWLAVAAIITGVLTFGLDLALPSQIVVFVSASLIAAFSARRFLKDSPIESSDPLLNQRGTRLIGDTAVVTQAFDGGSGRIKHGDSEWLAKGPDLGIGTRVRITGNDGAILIVEPAVMLPPPGESPSGEGGGGD
ncbi:NfeD family protein [Altererythrobacter litoralis]|uniref:NfeD family protein n=1 Tax=Altererythrobacter litoralis TaxID=3113904 RepID=A0ABU7GCE5_9SPHN|nr:NfeD family protein [Erythrobacteraceae bacterium 1XM1-14]